MTVLEGSALPEPPGRAGLSRIDAGDRSAGRSGPAIFDRLRADLVRLVAFWLVGALGLGAYLATAPSAPAVVIFAVVGMLAASALASGILLHEPSTPDAWWAITGALALYSASAVAQLVLSGTTVWWIADVVAFGAYPAAAYGVSIVARARNTLVDRSGVLDAALVATAVSVVFWVLFIHPVAADVSMALTAKIITITYPVLDIFLLLVVLALVFGDRVKTASFVLVTFGLIAMLVGDFRNAVQLVSGQFAQGQRFDAVWLIGFLAFGGAGLHRSFGERIAPDRTSQVGVSSRRLGLLAAAASTPPVVLMFMVLSGPDLNRSNVAAIAAGSIGALGLASMRFRGMVLLTRRAVELRGEERFAAMVNNSNDVIALLDRNHRLLYVSPAMQSRFGYAPGSLLGRSFVDLIDLGQDEVTRMLGVAASADRGASVEFAGSIPNPNGGDAREFEATASNLFDDPAVRGIVLTLRDVTERQRLEAQLRHQAFHDALTGLDNRVLFEDRVGRALAVRERHPERTVAVLFIDLDDFKAINDGLGHRAGDQLLVAVGERLSSCLRPGDTAARLGGDEFSVLLEEDGASHRVVAIAQRIIESLQFPIAVGDIQVGVPISVGIAIAESDATPASLLRDADLAMYAAKANGKGRAEMFEPWMRDKASLRLELKTDLARAIERNDFRLVYQPVVDLETKEVIGSEALIRWNHPERGVVSPDEFIALAEQTGMISTIGAWVLAQACYDTRHWQRPGMPIGVSVNASSIQLRDPGFPDHVRTALAASGLEPRLLMIEMTETVLMDDLEVNVKVLEELRTMGCRVAIDDFGTGYCSLAYLKRFAVDVLKIDRAFIQELTDGSTRNPLAESILTIADALELTSIAEGIEEVSQVERLRELGCTYGQGFLFSPPLPAAEFMAMLDATSSTALITSADTV